MTDARMVDARCGESFSTDGLRPRLHRCVYREGHVGLHYSDRWWDRHGESESAVMRWGSPLQLEQEKLL